MRVIINPLVLLCALPAAAAAFKAKYPPAVAALVDESVSPCQDFYQYACGNWIKTNDIPADRLASHYHDIVTDSTRAVLLDIYKQGKPLIGELFQSCVNIEALNKAGTTPVDAVRAQIAAVETKGDLFRLAGKISMFGMDFMGSISVGADPKDATRNILSFSQASSTFSEKDKDHLQASSTESEKEKDPVEDDFTTKFIEYGTKIYTLNGVDKETAEQNIYTVIQLLNQVRKFFVLQDDPIASYNPMTIKDAMTNYHYTFGLAVVEGLDLFKTSSVKLTDTVIVTTPSYFDSIEELIKKTDINLLKIFLEYQYLNYAAEFMGQDFLDARFEFYGRYLNGQQAPSKRERTCARIVQESFPHLVGKYFFEAKFNTESEKMAQKMIHHIEKSMESRMNALTWLDAATRTQALKKLSQVINKIGHSATVEDFTAKLDPTAFLSNKQAIAEYRMKRTLVKINKPVDRTAWYMSGADANAYYDESLNEIVFPAGVMQPPFFSKDFHPVQNFGSIGFVMGHELTHGFDNSGRLYDGEGNLRQWWSNATNSEYENRTKCLVDQYSGFELKSDFNTSVSIGNVNGSLTLDENMADNGGFGLAFDAFHTYLSQTQPGQQQLQKQQQQRKQKPKQSQPQQHQQRQQKRKPKPTTAKPSDDFSLEDLERTFFLSFAQSWCSKTTDGYAKQLLKGEDNHSPNVFRVIGVIQNSPFFGDLFECAVGTPMNPKNKCQVW